MTTTDKLAERAAFEAWADTQVGSTDSTKNRRSIIDVWQEEGIRAALEAKPAPAGCVLVDRGALQMVRLALQRDADDGRTVRGEMLSALDNATHATPAAPPPLAALTPEWLWCQFMDWCKRRGSSPANYNDLFQIVDEARKLAAPAAPATDNEEALRRAMQEGNSRGVNSVDALRIIAAYQCAAPAAPAPWVPTEEQVQAAIDAWFDVNPGNGTDHQARMRAAIAASKKGGAA
jgi:hypothetical protein